MASLTILIAHLHTRVQGLYRLLDTLRPQLTDRVQVCIDADHGQTPIGEKRNRMIRGATGDFVVFIDDDDEIPSDYVARILAAIDRDPTVDCLASEGWVLRWSPQGIQGQRYIISLACRGWHETNGIYYRTPNHITPIARRHAQAVPFPPIRHAEDAAWSLALRPRLEREGRVRGALYYYCVGEWPARIR